MEVVEYWRDIFETDTLTDEQGSELRIWLRDVSPEDFAAVLRSVYQEGRNG